MNRIFGCARRLCLLFILLAGVQTVPCQTGRLSPWLDLQAGSVATRYKKTAATAQPWTHESQYQFTLRGRSKFDRNGRYYAGFRLGTGAYFTHSWNDTGVGPGGFEGRQYLKELFLSASPAKLFELQVGGLGFNRGESGELTSYSNNGYLTGERIAVRRPDRLFFDEISATGGYVGDNFEPGVFGRLHRLSQMNYHQFLVVKKIGRQISLSADYSFQDGIETLREAVRLQPPANVLVDSMLFENYQRLDFRPAWGFAVLVQRNATRRLAFNGGFVNVDRYYVNLNSDKLGRGRRLYVNVSYNFWRDFSALFFAGKAFANDFPVNNAARIDFAIMYDFLKVLKRAEIL